MEQCAAPVTLRFGPFGVWTTKRIWLHYTQIRFAGLQIRSERYATLPWIGLKFMVFRNPRRLMLCSHQRN